MTANHDQEKTEGKQFRLVKFFASASFIVLVIFSFPFSLAISQKAKDILLGSYEDYALLVGQNLSHQVFQNFAVPVLLRYNQIRLRDSEQQALMDRVVKNTIHGLKIDLVNIYDIEKGVIAYSTDPRLIGEQVKITPGYERAVAGDSSSRMISDREALFHLHLRPLRGEHKLRTYIPFRGVHPYMGTKSYVAGVFEIIQDMGEQHESITRFQYLVFTLSILIMGAIFLALILIVRKAETLIEERSREQRELEEQLHQAERFAALGEMVAGVSHEIKNPLGIIQSTAELMAGLSGTDETLRRLSGVIREESIRLNQIVTEFLDFARPQEPDFRYVSLAEILRKNLSFLKPELDKKGIRVLHNLDSHEYELTADSNLLHRAFLNILINALQAQEDGGTILVNLTEEPEAQRVEITDHGEGIPEESVRKLFNPFFTTKEKGTGLGLSIVKKIVEGHKGLITIQSEAGKGTSVIIRLPKEPQRWKPS